MNKIVLFILMLIAVCSNAYAEDGTKKFWDVDEKIIAHIANAYRLIFHGQTSVFDAVNQVVDQVPDGEQIRRIVNFVRATKLGIISKM